MSKSTKTPMNIAIVELGEFADIEGSEWGQTASALTDIWCSRALLSDKMVAALEREILAWLKDVKKNATIIVEKTVESRDVTLKSLEWNN